MPRIGRRTAQRQRGSRSRSFRRSSFYSIVAACAPLLFPITFIPCPRGFLFHLHARYRFVIRGSRLVEIDRPEGRIRDRVMRGARGTRQGPRSLPDRRTHLRSISGTNFCIRRSHAPRNSRKWPRVEIFIPAVEKRPTMRNYSTRNTSFLPVAHAVADHLSLFLSLSRSLPRPHSISTYPLYSIASSPPFRP